jgi:hypothetical protein
MYLVRQWNNVLVDVVLTQLGSAVGLRVAEKVVVSIGVLIFCWGSFAFIAAATGRAPWPVLPGIAMVAYGWTFQMGFMNYYISVGLALLAVALVWHGVRWDYLTWGVLCLLALLAHPIGFVWAVGGAIYCRSSDRLPLKFQWTLVLTGLFVVVATHYYVSHTYKPYGSVGLRAVLFTGPDQLVLYGHDYRVLAGVTFFIGVASFLLGVMEQRRTPTFWQSMRTPLELWAIAVFAAAMLWEGIQLPHYAMGLTFLPERLTSITAVLGLCVLGCVRLRTSQFMALAGCAIVFFSWLYRDTGILNTMEQQAESLVSRLPSQARVIDTIFPFPGSRVAALHVVERACIEKCYVYSDYEPSTKQFRIRVSQGSPIAVVDAAAGLAMREGRYVVQTSDLPMFQIYQCNEKDLTKLCLRNLAAGEINGRIGYHPTY